MVEGIKGAVKSEGYNPLTGQVHQRTEGTVNVLTSDLVVDLKPGDVVPKSKISPAVAEALNGRSVIVTKVEQTPKKTG